jgi:hypothetical protein
MKATERPAIFWCGHLPSRAMRYAAMSKSVSEPLGQFIKSKGGINDARAGSLGVWGTLSQRIEWKIWKLNRMSYGTPT